MHSHALRFQLAALFAVLVGAARLAAAECEGANGEGDGTPEACEPQFTLGFEGYPAQVGGQWGSTTTVKFWVTLTGKNVPEPGTVQGWSLSVVAEGAPIQSLRPSVWGVHVQTVFDHDGDDPERDGLTDHDMNPETPPVPATPDLDPYELDLARADFKMAKYGFPGGDPRLDDRSFHGAYSQVILNMTNRMTLRAEGTHRILEITMTIRFPLTVSCVPVRLSIEDGAGYNGPTKNLIILNGRLVQAERTTATILVCAPIFFRRGDVNTDGVADISDAVALLSYLFLGGPQTSCLDAADVNNDDALDLADAVFLLADSFSNPFEWSFIPLPGRYDCGPESLTPMPDAITCDAYPLCE